MAKITLTLKRDLNELKFHSFDKDGDLEVSIDSGDYYSKSFYMDESEAMEVIKYLQWQLEQRAGINQQ